MERIAAIVEGHTEYHFVKATYANSIVMRTIPNGHSVSLPSIVGSINDALETLGGEIITVVVLLDREGRDTTAEDMASFVLANVVAGPRRLCVGISDRQIENWIVADEEEMRRRFNAPLFSYPGDGSAGKSVLKALAGALGPLDTALLLKSCSAARASVRSASLAAFIKSVGFDWAWATA